MSFLGPLNSYTLPAAGLLLPFVTAMSVKEPKPPSEVLARHKISPADVIRLERRDLLLRMTKTASFWAAVAVFPSIVPVPLPAYQAVVGTVVLLSVLHSFRMLFQFDWRSHENREAFQRAEKEASRLGAELKELCERREAASEWDQILYLELREALHDQVSRMERARRASPERALQGNLTLGVLFLFAGLIETFLRRPADPALMCLVTRRHQSLLAQWPERLAFPSGHAYRGTTSGKTPV
jgi:hypothetical protein